MKLHEWANSEQGSAFLTGVIVGDLIATAFFLYLIHVQTLIIR